MAATSIKIPPELKKRVIAAAKAAGKSPHAFMVQAIEQQTSRAEARQAFVRDAEDAREAMERSSLGYDAAEVHAYLTRRAQGQRATRPKARPWRG
jgi:predicted transcriptional regulator